MPTYSPQTVKLKSQLRLVIERLRNAQKKDNALSVAARRGMATLLTENREASARIRVESIIQTDICVEVMEILELYAELLLARAGLLDMREKEAKNHKDGEEAVHIDSGLEEAAAAMIYAAPRLQREIRELSMVRNLLAEKWGKEFAARANENRDGIVPEKVVKKLKVEPPGDRLVELYLTEIARTYGVDWPKQTEVEGVHDLQEEVNAEEANVFDDDQPGAGAVDGGPSTPATKRKVDLGRPFERDELSKATPPRDIGPAGAKSPVSVAPPAPSTDNPTPGVRVPGGDTLKKSPTTASSTGTGGGTASNPNTTAAAPKNIVGGKIPDVDDLQRRFQALKR